MMNRGRFIPNCQGCLPGKQRKAIGNRFAGLNEKERSRLVVSWFSFIYFKKIEWTFPIKVGKEKPTAGKEHREGTGIREPTPLHTQEAHKGTKLEAITKVQKTW